MFPAILSALMAGALGAVVGAGPSAAVVSPSQQFVTNVTGNINNSGDDLSLVFGASGVTGSYVVTTLSTGEVFANNTPLSGVNVTTFLEPDPPPASARVLQTTFTTSHVVGTVTLNRPVVQPILHVVNLDASTVTVSGTSTTGSPITLVPLMKNNEMEISGNTLNSVPSTPDQTGCEDNAGANPNGACGSIALTAATGAIQSFTLSSNGTAIGDDGWSWTLSFPTAPLTAAFSPVGIQAGGISSLTLTVANPESTTLTPLDFTATLPAGVTLTNGTSANNGSCGAPTITDSAGNPLAAGTTSVRATGMSVAGGATCTITVFVTSVISGTYPMTPGSATSTVGNLVSQINATLMVTPRVASKAAVVAASTNWSLGNGLPGTSTIDFTYGGRPLVPLIGDWDGNGTKTVGTFERGTFKLNNANDNSAADLIFDFGDPRGYAVAGDFDGNGFDDVAVTRCGNWEIHFLGTGAPANRAFILDVPFSGNCSWPATVPVAGDWNGDGIDGIGTYELSTGKWVLKNTATSGAPDFGPFVFWGGASTSYPVVGDWNAIGIDTPGYRVGTQWTVRTAAVTSGATATFAFGAANSVPFTW